MQKSRQISRLRNPHKAYFSAITADHIDSYSLGFVHWRHRALADEIALLLDGARRGLREKLQQHRHDRE
jgi:hypothetical protein